MTPSLDEFGEQRPELRTPARTDDGEQACPRCEVPLEVLGDSELVEIPVDAWDRPTLVERCKEESVEWVRSRAWSCSNHSREVLLFRTVDSPRASGWEGCCGAEIRLDDGTTTYVPFVLADLPAPLQTAIGRRLES